MKKETICALNPAFKNFRKLSSESHAVFGVMIQTRRNFKNIIPMDFNNLKQKMSVYQKMLLFDAFL